MVKQETVSYLLAR